MLVIVGQQSVFAFLTQQQGKLLVLIQVIQEQYLYSKEINGVLESFQQIISQNLRKNATELLLQEDEYFLIQMQMGILLDLIECG